MWKGWKVAGDRNHNYSTETVTQQKNSPLEKSQYPVPQDPATEEEDIEREDRPNSRRPKEIEQGLIHPSVKPGEEVPGGFVCSICPPDMAPLKYSNDHAIAAHAKKHFDNREKDLHCSVWGGNHRSNFLDLVSISG